MSATVAAERIATWVDGFDRTPAYLGLAEALRLTGAPGVDVSSGVESAPGVKDAALIAAFTAAVLGAPGGSPR